MSMELFITGYYQASAEALFDQTLRLPDAGKGTHHSSRSAPLTTSRLEEGKVYGANMSGLGFLKVQNAQIKIERICPTSRVLESTECSSVVRCLRHKLHIKPIDTGAVWIDRFMIDAGAFTLFLSKYIMYTHQKSHGMRGATLVERFSAKSYRSPQIGLPMFQTVEGNPSPQAISLCRTAGVFQDEEPAEPSVRMGNYRTGAWHPNRRASPLSTNR